MKKRWLAIPVVAALVAVIPAFASHSWADPSPYCRAQVSIPWGVREAPAGGGHYTVTVEGDATITCNGSANLTVIPVLHYSTDPCQGGCGALRGSPHTCRGSCGVSIQYTRTLFCGYHYTFSDYTQLTGTWSGGGHSGSFAQEGARSNGSSYNPGNGICH